MNNRLDGFTTQNNLDGFTATDELDMFTTPEEVMNGLALRFRKRRLEKGISRPSLQRLSGVPAPTIARFENTSKISLESFVKMVMVLGYSDELEKILSETKYRTMQEMEEIKRNRRRQRGYRK